MTYALDVLLFCVTRYYVQVNKMYVLFFCSDIKIYNLSCHVFLRNMKHILHINENAEKCWYLSVTNRFIVFHNSIKLVPDEKEML